MPVISVPFNTSEKLEAVGIDRIEPNECTSGFLTKKNNIADGAYVFEFTRSNGKEERRVPGILQTAVRFKIKPDTVVVKFE